MPYDDSEWFGPDEPARATPAWPWRAVVAALLLTSAFCWGLVVAAVRMAFGA